MLSRIIKAIFRKKPDIVSVYIERTGALLMVHLCVNERRTAKIQCVIESDTTILIGDIQHHNEKSDYNKGYGSRMMEELLAYARAHQFRYVYGNLSVVDLDHKDRLHHFYEKYGFTVTEYPEPQGMYYGKIELRL